MSTLTFHDVLLCCVCFVRGAGGRNRLNCQAALLITGLWFGCNSLERVCNQGRLKQVKLRLEMISIENMEQVFKLLYSFENKKFFQASSDKCWILGNKAYFFTNSCVSKAQFIMFYYYCVSFNVQNKKIKMFSQF